MWQALCDRLARVLNTGVEYIRHSSVSGGCIHNAQALETNKGTFFVKINRIESLPMFEAEAAGLEAIQETAAIRCPTVYFADTLADQAVLVLEYIPMQAAQPGSMKNLGKQLASLHKTTGQKFGWHRHNNIGLTPQENTESEDWISFFKEQRLEFQMNLCAKKGLRLPGGKDLEENLDSFFQDYNPLPSLLHGDLWGGNVGFDAAGEPVIFDPACYYGDREADLAFTEMFGGFSAEFYASYQEELPLNPGYRIRKRLYNLYHELNHYYLFGGGYGRQAQETVRSLLRDI